MRVTWRAYGGNIFDELWRWARTRLAPSRSMRRFVIGVLVPMVACTRGVTEPAVSPLPTTNSVLAPASSAPAAKAEETIRASEVSEVSLPHLWTSAVGATDHRSTMAVVGRLVVIGSHGGSFDALDELADGVYLLDGATGHVIRRIATPGRGKLDVNGVAVDSVRVLHDRKR